MAVTLTKEFWTNLVIFVVACVALGLSIWALATPCKKDGFVNTMTYSDFKKMTHLAPVVNNGVTRPWVINNRFLTSIPPPFFGPPFNQKLNSNAKNPLMNCNDSGCSYNPAVITEKSFNNLLTAINNLKDGNNLVRPKSYYDLSEWIPV